MAGGVEALGGGDRQIRLAKKGEKRSGEESPDHGVGRKAAVQVTTHLNEDLGSNGMFLAVQSLNRKTFQPVEEPDGIEMVKNVLVRRSLASEEACIRGHCVGCGR